MLTDGTTPSFGVSSPEAGREGALGNLGVPEMLVIVVVALLVFGPNKVPEVARQVGRGMRELRRLQESLRGDVAELLDFGDDGDDAGVADGPFHLMAPSPTRWSPPAPRLRPVPGPAPVAAPSRFRTPTGTRMRSLPHDRPALPVPDPPLGPPPPRVQAPSRFRPPRDAS
jgi:TatA/E family protein of Tat protein translocase